MRKPQQMNNVQKNIQTSTLYDEKHIEESLRDFAHILHDYLIVLEEKCPIKKMNY